MNVEGKTAIVTGGSGGIGEALARHLVGAGAKVVVADLDSERAERTAASIGSADTALGIGADVGDQAALEGLLAATSETFGAVDLYFANAGVVDGAGLAPEEDWELALHVNLMAHVRAARLLVDDWVERGEGYFVATASAAGLLSSISRAPYAVTKHAAVSFAEWLSITYGDAGVRVSCLCPMGVDTEMLRTGLSDGDGPSTGSKVVESAGTILTPDEVATVVMEAVADERFLILPHPEVLEFYRRKGLDYDRWLRGMRRLQAASEID